MFNYYICPPIFPFHSFTTETQDSPKIQPQIQNDLKKQKSSLQRNYNILRKKYQDLKRENQVLKLQIRDLQAYQPEEKKKKIKRRTETELQKSFGCPYTGCKKEYASTLALNLHIKVKHNGGTKKQRMAVLKNILNAQKNGLQMPEISINLPPNFIQTHQKDFMKFLQRQNSQQQFNEFETVKLNSNQILKKSIPQ